MRVTAMGPLKISSQVRAWPGLSCAPSVLLHCPPSTSPPWGSVCITASLLLFLSFFFFLSFPAMPSYLSVLKTVPFTAARTGKRTSRLLCEASLGEEIPL